jgi:Predicted nucleotide-binding protein containing TIR -like domain
MARSKSPQPPSPEPPQVAPAQGLELLQELITKAEELLRRRPLSSDDSSAWEILARNYLEKAFGRYSPNITDVLEIGKYGSFPMNAGEQFWENHRSTSLQSQKRALQGLVELLQTELKLRQGNLAKSDEIAHGRKVFLVHGHDERFLHETARFLEKLQQDVTVLREQPSQGRTIIEKFETAADVGFAVVLLTNDDKGGPTTAKEADMRPRARQNVIFELGYFIGKLGRKRVCALFAEGTELPSDYSGVLYVKLDAHGAWRLELAKELKAAGLPVDMNLAL